MATLNNPHDKLFRETWSRKTEVRSFLTHYLPAELAQSLDLESLVICKDSFVAEQLQDWFSDILYMVNMHEQPVYLYLLFEHKSTPDRLVHLQLLEYMVQIWRLHLKQGGSDELPMILPIVIAHGQRRWHYGLHLSDLLSEPKELLRPYLPDFTFLLYDLVGWTDAEIHGTLLLRIVLWLLKHIFDDDFAAQTPELFRLLGELMREHRGTRLIEMIFRYLSNTTDTIKPEQIENLANQSPDPERRELIMTLAQQLEQRGYDKGLQQGLQQGRQEAILDGLCQAIEIGLQVKFGLDGLKLMPTIYAIRDPNYLRLIKNSIPTIQALTEIQALLPEQPSASSGEEYASHER